MAHAYERALAIQKGMRSWTRGWTRVLFTFALIARVFGSFRIARKAGMSMPLTYATYGSTHEEAKMAYVLTHMALPIPMDDWLREYR
jgi:hypothetical protein